MLYSDQKNIKDKITELLINQRLSVKQIKAMLEDRKEQYSLQAIYDALRILISAGVVLKHKQEYFVSNEWKKQVVQHLHTIPEEPILQPNEMQRYVFRSTVQLDKFWKHTNATLTQRHPEEPFFFFNPHEFWLYNLEQTSSQESFLRSFSSDTRSAYMLIGGETSFDTTYRNRFKDHLSIQLDAEVKYRRHEHLTVFNDFVITTKLPTEVATTIDTIYKTAIDEVELEAKLAPIFTQDMKLTVTISNDKEKAVRIRKRIAKDLYVPLVERERFELF